MTQGFLLGVDAGNTKTVALLARPDGRIVGAGRALGCADIHATSVEMALERIETAVADAFSAAPGMLAAAGWSLAGADWPEDHDVLAAALADRWPDLPGTVVNDGIGGLRAAVPSGPGVAVVCGTGAATAARGPSGRTWHASFWQEPQGADELGVKTLLALRRAWLGIDPPTALSDAVCAYLGEPDVEAVNHRWTRREAPWRDVPTLAPLLLDVAGVGDPTAVAIASDHGAALGRWAVAAARQVGIEGGPFPLALTGGVLRHPVRILRDALVACFEQTYPEAVPVQPVFEPAVGALLLAFDVAGIAVSPEIDAALHATLPPASLFDTKPPR